MQDNLKFPLLLPRRNFPNPWSEIERFCKSHEPVFFCFVFFFVFVFLLLCPVTWGIRLLAKHASHYNLATIQGLNVFFFVLTYKYK